MGGRDEGAQVSIDSQVALLGSMGAEDQVAWRRAALSRTSPSSSLAPAHRRGRDVEVPRSHHRPPACQQVAPAQLQRLAGGMAGARRRRGARQPHLGPRHGTQQHIPADCSVARRLPACLPAHVSARPPTHHWPLGLPTHPVEALLVGGPLLGRLRVGAGHRGACSKQRGRSVGREKTWALVHGRRRPAAALGKYGAVRRTGGWSHRGAPHLPYRLKSTKAP